MPFTSSVMLTFKLVEIFAKCKTYVKFSFFDNSLRISIITPDASPTIPLSLDDTICHGGFCERVYVCGLNSMKIHEWKDNVK